MAQELADIKDITSGLRHKIKTTLEVLEDISDTTVRCFYINQLVQYQRQLAIAEYLAFADKKQFNRLLTQSIQSSIDLLTLATKTQDDDLLKYLISSKNVSVFSAISINRTDLAICLSQLACDDFHEDRERVYTFTYMRFLKALLENDFKLSEIDKGLIDEVSELNSKIGDVRLSLCQSIIENDIENCHDKFENLLNWHLNFYSELGSTVLADKYIYRTEQFVFLEGAAILKIFEKMNIPLLKKFRCIPYELFD